MDGTSKRFRFDHYTDAKLFNSFILAEPHVPKTGEVKAKMTE